MVETDGQDGMGVSCDGSGTIGLHPSNAIDPMKPA